MESYTSGIKEGFQQGVEKGKSLISNFGMTNIIYLIGIPIFWLVVLLVSKPWIVMDYPEKIDKLSLTQDPVFCKRDKCSGLSVDDVKKSLIIGNGSVNILKFIGALVALTVITYIIMAIYYFANRTKCN